jgi:hypothetical protein
MPRAEVPYAECPLDLFDDALQAADPIIVDLHVDIGMIAAQGDGRGALQKEFGLVRRDIQAEEFELHRGLPADFPG